MMTTEAPKTATTWPLADLKDNALNPRGPVFEDEQLRELSASITEHGILQPLVITPDGTLIAGHRRAFAARLAGLTDVPVTVRDLGQTQQLAAMLTENIQRRELTPLQLARGCKRLADAGMSPTHIARMIGKVQSWVQKLLTMLTLPRFVLTAIEQGELSASQAAAMGRFADRPEIVAKVFDGARRFGMSSTAITALDDNGENPHRRNRQPQPGTNYEKPDPFDFRDLPPSEVDREIRTAERITIADYLRDQCRAMRWTSATRTVVIELATDIEAGKHLATKAARR